ncbi:MAG TPA: PH domain-containing protein [Acidimicrobiales bacterium]|nr:PH domain-containing protein [Acidimicrobiales bacterium]
MTIAVPTTVILALLSAFGNFPPAAPFVGSLLMITFALFRHRRSFVEVDDAGVTVVMGGRSRLVPWSDIELLKSQRLSVWIERRSAEKPVVILVFDVHWADNPVVRAIQAHLMDG